MDTKSKHRGALYHTPVARKCHDLIGFRKVVSTIIVGVATYGHTFFVDGLRG
jgi:hypothetical protein